MRLLFAILACVVPAFAAASDAPASPRFPTLAVDTVDGQRFDLAQHRGRWVVINFWATWCSPCIKEIPDLSAFNTARDDVQVVGLAFEEIELGDLRAFLRKHPASYPIAVIDVYNPPADFEVPRGLPTSYLIAPDGSLAERFIGPVTSAQLALAIEKHGPRR